MYGSYLSAFKNVKIRLSFRINSLLKEKMGVSMLDKSPCIHNTYYTYLHNNIIIKCDGIIILP